MKIAKSGDSCAKSHKKHRFRTPIATFFVFLINPRFSAKCRKCGLFHKFPNLALFNSRIWPIIFPEFGRIKNCPHLNGCFRWGQFQLCFATLQLYFCYIAAMLQSKS